jgi:hypothetical protein
MSSATRSVRAAATVPKSLFDDAAEAPASPAT